MEQGVNRVGHPIILASPGDWNRCCALGGGGERIIPHPRQDRNPSHVLAGGLFLDSQGNSTRPLTLGYILLCLSSLNSVPFHAEEISSI